MKEKTSTLLLIIGWCLVTLGAYQTWGLAVACIVGGIALMFARP